MKHAQIILSRIKANKLDSYSEINGGMEGAAKKHECSDQNWKLFSSLSISCESCGESHLTFTLTEPIISDGMAK